MSKECPALRRRKFPKWPKYPDHWFYRWRGQRYSDVLIGLLAGVIFIVVWQVILWIIRLTQ